jgi:hypothetical protein
MQNSFTDLWGCLPGKECKLWNYDSSDFQKYSRKRAILELLCGALFHLELASQLGNFPSKKMIESLKKCNGWNQWREKSKDLFVEFSKEGIIVKYPYPDPSHSAPYLLQSMLIADAVFRLDGCQDLLRSENNNSFLVSDRRTIDKWIDAKSGTFKEPTDEIKKQLAIVVTFRDAYMHGEKQEKDIKGIEALLKFRESFFVNYSLVEVVEACRQIWKGFARLAGFSKI